MENLRRFDGKVLLLTGGGTGIGRGIALRMAQEGAVVAIHDTNMEAARKTADDIQSMGEIAHVYQCDVSNVQQVRAAIDATLCDFGKIDLLVCNAGINKYKELFDFTDEDWAQIIGVNLTGVWNYCRYVSEKMADNGGGSIVNISSIGSMSASYMRVPYMSSKGGVKMLTQALAQDLGKYNIRVNAVAPGCVETEMTRPDEDRPGVSSRDMIVALTALHRYGKPEDIAAATAFLLSGDAAYITGTTLIVDGGMNAGNTIGLPIRQVPKPGYNVPWLDGFDHVQQYKKLLADADERQSQTGGVDA